MPPRETESAAPKSITTDGLTIQEHSLPDQIAADKYLKQDAQSKLVGSGKLPIHMFRFKPPGSV